jgi:hypothetical protein
MGKTLSLKKRKGRAFHGAWHPVSIAFAGNSFYFTLELKLGT